MLYRHFVARTALHARECMSEEIENAIDLIKLNLSVKRVTAGLEEVLFKELLDCFVEG